MNQIDDQGVVDALKRGEEAAFRRVVTALHPGLVRMARIYVGDAFAEEVVQDTWLAVIRHIDRFEGRSSLRTWVFRIMLNTARTRATREARVIPFSAAGPAAGPTSPAVDPEHLMHPELGASYWPAPPPRWDTLPEERLMSAEVRKHLTAAIRELPPAQREVVSLRDVEGWSAVEVCNALGISAVNQRVLLHRGRTTLRAKLEELLSE